MSAPDAETYGADALAQGPGFQRELRIGAAVVVVFVGSFVLWSLLAPLASAAVASGRVVVRDSRKTVQHLEGGIIREILVRAGDSVEEGDVLLRLDETQSLASSEMLQSRHDALSAEYARLSAEQMGLAELRFPEAILARRSQEPRLSDLLSGQERIFQKRREAILGRLSILEQTISQLGSEVASYEAQVASTDRQLESVREQMQNVEALVERGFESRPRLLEFRRQTAELEGTRQSASALAARARQKVGEARLEMTQIESDHLNEVVSQQQEIRSQLAETEERLRAAGDVLQRREVLAPIAGTVVDLQHFTLGGVIRAGEAILDIVPTGGELLIKAQVQPNDIESVRVGLDATVRITAFRQRVVPPLTGRVEYVSADALVDAATGLAYYEAEISIPASELAHLGAMELQPGMPAEVLIVTGERSLFRYVFAPITDSFFRALHED